MKRFMSIVAAVILSALITGQARAQATGIGKTKTTGAALQDKKIAGISKARASASLTAPLRASSATPRT